MANIAIIGTSIRLDFPPNKYLVNEPIVLVTVSGGPTEVSISSPPEQIGGLGEVHTHIVLTFPTALVGKRANVWVAGQ